MYIRCKKSNYQNKDRRLTYIYISYKLGFKYYFPCLKPRDMKFWSKLFPLWISLKFFHQGKLMVEEYVIYVVLQNHFRISTHKLHYIKGNHSKHNVVNSFSSISTWRHSNALLLLGILSCVNDRRTNLHELILFLIYRLLYCTVRFLTYTRVWIDLVNVAE